MIFASQPRHTSNHEGCVAHRPECAGDNGSTISGVIILSEKKADYALSTYGSAIYDLRRDVPDTNDKEMTANGHQRGCPFSVPELVSEHIISPTQETEAEHLHGMRLVLVVLALCLSIFVMALGKSHIMPV